MKTIRCNKNNYDVRFRKYTDVRYIVIHFTAVNGDTAEGEALNFSRPGRKASAHFFIDRAGSVVKSVDLRNTAWSVGGSRYSDYKKTGGATYYGVCTNRNSVSIELCDMYTKHKYPSKAQLKALYDTIRYIRRYCPNVHGVIRHFDVTGKYCPRTMCKPFGSGRLWNKLRKSIKKECGI